MYVLAQDSTVNLTFTNRNSAFETVPLNSDATVDIPKSAFENFDNTSISGDTLSVISGYADSDNHTSYNVTAVAESPSDSTAWRVTAGLPGAGQSLNLTVFYTDSTGVDPVDSEEILPADRCSWHVLPSEGSNGYFVRDVTFYDGHDDNGTAQTGSWRLGFLGKTGRFTPITNTPDHTS